MKKERPSTKRTRPAAARGPRLETPGTDDAPPSVVAEAAADGGPVLYTDSESEAEDRAPVLPYLVVGIGVPPGRSGTLRELLGGLPAHAGVAVVIVQQGPPGQGPSGQQSPSGEAGADAELVAALANGPQPVGLAVHGETPVPDRVYVAPPGCGLRLEGGRFQLEPAPSAGRIDRFFRTLAADMRNRAVGVVLSGCEADGALGLKVIKAEGGITLVEDEFSSEMNGVARSAITSELADLCLRPEKIGEELGRIARLLGAALAEAESPPERESEEQLLLVKIYTLLRKSTEVDFTHYKQTTLRRRIARRMVVQRISTLAEYARFLQINPGEVKELYEDILINVTRFFRDTDTFAALRTDLLPIMLKDRPTEQPIRIWVPGCATGEEVYSLAITLLEHLGTVPFETPIQLFGTDISDRSIERARLGVYPESSLADVPADRLRRFFTKVEGGYQVVKGLRDLCVFARQNLASDPPFSRLDLISCRNVLIYLGPNLHKTIIPTFHYALKPNGFLLLGNSETIRDYANLFVLLDKRHKFFMKNSTAGRTPLDLSARTVPQSLLEPPRSEILATTQGWTELELQRAADRIVLARFGPPGVIINERADILQSRGHTSPFIELPPGTATLNLLRMVKENIAIALRDGIHRAVADDIPVRLDGLRLQLDDRSREITIEILPIQSQGRNTRCFLVLFIPDREPSESVSSGPAPAPVRGALSADERSHEVLQLRSDLASTKLYLQSLLEERDIANQELISANEEIQSSNEELQSINEELETAKEELQSTNEEIQTVNEELYNRNLELSQTSNDLLNLLNNITIPVLMLGSDLRIRQFTPIAERLLNVRSADIGRPIGEIRLNLLIDDLEPLLLEVIETLTTRELEVKDRFGRWHLLRARPYRTADNKIEGVVLVLIDIDPIRKSQQQLVEARDLAQAVIESAQFPLVVLGGELRIRSANRAFCALCEQTPEDIEGRTFTELAARKWNLDTLRPLLESIQQRQRGQEEFELEHETAGTCPQILQISARAILADSDPVILVAVQDITARKQAEHLLRGEKERLEGRVEVTERALDRSREELRGLTASLFTAQEEERRRVSRELHDDLAQKVAVLDLCTERIQRVLENPSDAVRANVQELRTHITELATDLRRIAYQLHPAILDDLGLDFALRELIEEFGRREGMPVRFTSRNVPKKVPPSVGGALYRITQEALRNVAKHAGKTQVKVQLSGAQRELRLQIQDHGNGFEPGAARGRGGMGILNMEERARLSQGSFSLKSNCGDGVRIDVCIPLPAAR